MKIRLAATLAAMLILLAGVMAVLPGVLPWNRLNTFYGLLDPETGKQAVRLSAGQDGAELLVCHSELQGDPECWLTLEGKRIARVNPGENTPVRLDAAVLETPGVMEFRLEYVLCPFLSLHSNSALIEVD